MNNKNQGNACGVCSENKPDKFRIWFDGHVKLYKCLTCSFIAQYPGPGEYTIVDSYKDCYSSHFSLNGQEFMYPNRRIVLQDIVNRISLHMSNGRLLDVGCGDGHFLYLCKNKGFDCYGVEDSLTLSTYAQQKTNTNIIRGLYEKNMFAENMFDIISFIQVLEHIPNPITALNVASYHLKPNGILILEVPSVKAPNFLAYQWTGIKYFVKPPTGVIKSHFGYYSPKSLEILTERCAYRKSKVITGRWQYKYTNILGKVGKIIDPLLNSFGIGGILYIGKNGK